MVDEKNKASNSNNDVNQELQDDLKNQETEKDETKDKQEQQSKCSEDTISELLEIIRSLKSEKNRQAMNIKKEISEKVFLECHEFIQTMMSLHTLVYTLKKNLSSEDFNMYTNTIEILDLKILQSLERHMISPLIPIVKKDEFDSKYHSVVHTIASNDEVKANTIVEVVSIGYYDNKRDCLLKPCSVIVAV